MLKWLRTGNPYTIFFLLLYALVINFYYLTHPIAPLLAPLSDGFLYEPLVHWLKQKVGLGTQGFSILTFILLFVEALILNAQVNRFKILSGTSFFTAFSFLLFSCFFPEWNVFSAPLVAGLPLLILITQLFKLHDTPNGRAATFNMGLVVGITSLLYLPAVVLLLSVWFALLLTRPFKPTEWILAIIGVLCPWYFIATILFLANKLELLTILPFPGFSFPTIQYSYKVLAGLVGLLIYFLYGSIRLQQVYSTKFIRIRKSWVSLLALLIIGLVLPFLPDGFHTTGWLIAFFPMSIIIACGFWNIRKKWFGLLLHLLALCFVFFLQWVH